MKTASIDEVVATLKQGRMAILVDDELRENEGDFIMVAEKVTPEAISFMAEQARTIITLALTSQRCSQLGLELMSVNGGNPQDTAFTVTIEAVKGITTGSSAQDRTKTVKAAVAKDATARDLVRPGHVFPLRAVDGGVLNRAGHTEASCDLARLAGFEPAALISEIQLSNGSMARRTDLDQIAKDNNMPITTIANLISYRLQRESLITKISTEVVETSFGKFEAHTYKDSVSDGIHVALVRQDKNDTSPPLVRVIAHPNYSDYLALNTRRSWSIPAAFKRFESEKSAMLIMLQVDSPTDTLTSEAVETQESPQSSLQVRTYGIGAQILRDLQVTDMRLLSSPLTLPSMEGFGLNVIETIQP